MPTTPPIPALPSTPPTIPLTPAARDAYQDIYNKLQDEIENTTDGIALETLNDARDQVDDVLDMDDSYQLSKNTALFNDLATQIQQTNTSLATLKKQIAAVASHISTASTIIAAVDKVLTMFPAF